MDLKSGSRGQDVTIWQNFLISRKIDLSPFGADGDWGDTTTEGTKLWQERAGLKVTGTLNLETYQKATEYGLGSLSAKITEKPVDDPPELIFNLFPETLTKVQMINESRLSRIAPVVADRVRQFIKTAQNDGMTLQVVQGLRSFAEQDALFAQGRTRPGEIVTNARGGQSLHNYGLAVDLAPVIDNKISWKESLFKKFNSWDDVAGLDWGGNWKKFKDLPHLQDTEGMDLAHVQKLYRNGGLGLVWSKVK